MPDLRKHRRIPASFTCRLMCGDKTVVLQATIVDVSFGGMGAIVPVEIAVGAAVECMHCDFPFADGSSATSRCCVTSVRPSRGRFSGFRTGLKFETPDADFVTKLLQWQQMQAFVQKKNMERTGAARPKWP